MKKKLFFAFSLFLLIFLLAALVSFALVPDSDHDGVPDDKDQCPNSQTTVVDQFGCGCEQRNCPSDNNPCTDDCGFVNGVSTCRFTNNNNQCFGGYCSNGVCIQSVPTNVPEPPFDLKAITVDSLYDDTRKVGLSWSNVNGEAFNIYRSVNDELFSRIFKTGEKYYEEKISKQKKYGYYVTALNTYGESGPSNYVYVYPNTTTTYNPVLYLSSYEISNGDTVWVTVTNGKPYSPILFYVYEEQSGKKVLDGVQAGPTDSNGKWSINFVAQDWQTGDYKMWVSVAGTLSETIKFTIKPSIKVPVFDINPRIIHNGDTVSAGIYNAEKNSAILLYEVNAVDGSMPVNGDVIGQTDSNGKWSTSLVDNGWGPGSYKVWVKVAGTMSNTVGIDVMPPPPSCSLSFNPHTASQGQNVVASWSSTGDADGILQYSCTNGASATVPSSGQTTFSATESLTCTITASNSAGASICKDSITVFP